jgi:hypothetical protein
MLLLLSLAWGAPEDAPLEAMAQRQLGDSGIHRMTGQPGYDPFAVQAAIAQLTEVDAGLAIRLDKVFSSFSAPDTKGVRWGVREWGRVAGGALKPVNFLGDDPGLGSLRGGLAFWARSSHFSLMLRPELRLDVGCEVDTVCGQAPLTEGSLGVHWGGFDFRVGAQERSAGPGARGHLILGRDIRPWPAATVAYSRDSKVGKLAGEWGLGWLPGEREDVQNPGLQHMDFRWSPSAWLELGFTRATMFAGQERPWPSFVGLLLPISPHVSGDPNQFQADSNEIAALDFRLNVPLKGVFHRLSIWYEYGGEDMIMGKIGPVPVPQLAGPANLAGGELSVGDWSLTAERALLLDDTFRWYTGHRIYHEGFVRDGHAIGHPQGGDTDSWWFAAAWYGLPVGAEVFHERVRRVGVVESNPEGVFRFASQELSWQAGARAWLLPLRGTGVGAGGHWELGLSVGQVQAENFVPGQDAWRHRAWIAFSRVGP